MSSPENITGLIPAAGFARRLSPLPCSKEILPVGINIEGSEAPVKVSSQFLLDNMRLAGVRKACIILRRGKWDIPSYFGDGRIVGINLAYFITPINNGVPFTVNVAHAFVKDSVVVFGFPDILFKPKTAYIDLLQHLDRTRADVVLGLFRAHQPSKMDMVALDRSGRIERIDIKPSASALDHTWIIAVWTPVFTRFINRFILDCHTDNMADGIPGRQADGKEVFLGDVIGSAIQAKLKVENVIFDDGDYLDIGTPEDLIRAPAFTQNY